MRAPTGISIPLLALFTLLSTCVLAQLAPEPPVNTRWSINADFTDEFNGDELDDSKWFDYHPRWLGREPAIFLPRSVSVKDGSMQIKNTKLAQDTMVTAFNGNILTYSIGGGAVVSKKTEAYHGYYEVRMRASDVRMSSTFWMSNPLSGGECPNYSLELDVIEAIGGASPGNATFSRNMKSNTHYYVNECSGQRRVFSQGGQAPIGGDNSEAFHTYGCWWVDENNMIFYIDGRESHRIRANTGGSDRPFDRPMHINMVTETYDWETPPTAADLADDSRNTTYYDWIHAFEMFDVDEEAPVDDLNGNLLENASFETGNFDSWVGWGGNPREVIAVDDAPDGDFVTRIANGGAPEYILNLDPNTEYKVAGTAKVTSGSVRLGIKVNDATGTTLNSVLFNEGDHADWTRQEFTFTTGEETNLKLFFFAMAGANDAMGDLFSVTRTEAVEPPPAPLLLQESFEYKNLPALTTSTTNFDVSFLFKTNEPRPIYLQLKDANGNDIGDEVVYTALPGYGHKQMSFTLPAGAADGEDFLLVATMRDVPGAEGIILNQNQLRMTVNGSTVSARDVAIEQVRVFPNPANDWVRVEGNYRNEPYHLLDVTGRRVLEGVMPANGTIDVATLRSGVYVLRVGQRAAGRIVKQ